VRLDCAPRPAVGHASPAITRMPTIALQFLFIIAVEQIRKAWSTQLSTYAEMTIRVHSMTP